MDRKINAAGLTILKRFEGCELKAYRCPAGVWTIGYGSTGKQVKPGMVISVEEAEALLRDDLSRFERAVAEAAGSGTNDNQFSAMVCLAYNIGTGAFSKSTLLKKHLAGDFDGAAQQFLRWTVAGGRVLNGLVRRRKAEADLYGRAPV